MAAVEFIDVNELPGFEVRPTLRLATSAPTLRPIRVGRSLEHRRAARARMMRRRRRTLVGLVLIAGLVILSWPGHAFGGVTGTGLPTDLANSSVVASGTVYEVQAGDTVASIAAKVNPLDPHLARVALVRELGSAVVVPGEHVLIP